MRRLLALALVLLASATASATTPSVAGICYGRSSSATSQACNGFGAITQTSDILVLWVYGSGTIGVSGCGATWTVDAPKNSAAMATGITPTIGACTPVVTASTGTVWGNGIDITNAGGIRARGTTITIGYKTAGTTLTAPSVAAQVGDLVVGLYQSGNGGATLTAGACGTGCALALSGASSDAIEIGVANTNGSIAPTASFNVTATDQGASLSIIPGTPAPTLNSLFGVTVGSGIGNIHAINGIEINPANGYMKTFAGLPVPFTALTRDALLDFVGGSNGVTINATSLANSMHGYIGTLGIVTSDVFANLISATSAHLSPLVRPISLQGAIYNGSESTLGLQCTTGTTGSVCGSAGISWSNVTASASLGFTVEWTCPAILNQDCGALGGLGNTTATDYTMFHVQPPLVAGQPQQCFIEAKGMIGSGAQAGNTFACWPNTPYRVNIQLNQGTGSNSNNMTVCDAQNNLLGSFSEPTAGTTQPNEVFLGMTGEEPHVAGYVYLWSNFVLSASGVFSTTGCVL